MSVSFYSSRPSSYSISSASSYSSRPSSSSYSISSVSSYSSRPSSNISLNTLVIDADYYDNKSIETVRDILKPGIFTIAGKNVKRLMQIKESFEKEIYDFLTMETGYFDKYIDSRPSDVPMNYYNLRDFIGKYTQIKWSYDINDLPPIEMPAVRLLYDIYVDISSDILRLLDQFQLIPDYREKRDLDKTGMTLAYYQIDKQLDGLDTHTDNGLFTILSTNAPGLEIKVDRDIYTGLEWATIPYDAPMVLFGDDAMEYGFHVPEHRVTRLHKEKISAIYFV